MADPALGLDDAAVQEVKVGIEAVEVEQRHVIELTGTAMDSRRGAVFGGIGVDDARGERLTGNQRGNCQKRQEYCFHVLLLADGTTFRAAGLSWYILSKQEVLA